MNNFRGWKSVFSFNYKQNAGAKSYILLTTFVAIALFAAAIIISIVAAKPSKEEEEQTGEVTLCEVEQVYVLDLAGVGELKFAECLPQLQEEYYSNLTFNVVSGMTEEELQVKAAQEESGRALGVVIAKEDAVISVRALVPSTSEELSLYNGQDIAEMVAICVEQARRENSGLSELQLSQLSKEVVLNIADAGEEPNLAVLLVKMLAPAIFGLLLYFMLIMYGQNINQSVSVEKTSKLVETLLTSLHPYALLAGKVFAVVAAAPNFILFSFCKLLKPHCSFNSYMYLVAIFFF